jgi:putative ABC transport system substrate-binding protein
MRLVGVLLSQTTDDPEVQARVEAFRRALQQLGWTEGRNLQIDMRWVEGDAERLRKYASELAALTPDVILGTGNSPVGQLLQATRTVPIVFVTAADPVGAGFVTSLARPAGNATGFLSFDYSISAKWLELLKEITPNLARIGVVQNPAIPAAVGQFAVIQAAAPSASAEVSALNVHEHRRDRERYRDFRARHEWRFDSNGQFVSVARSEPNSCTSREAEVADGVLRTSLRHRRRVNFLWSRLA